MSRLTQPWQSVCVVVACVVALHGSLALADTTEKSQTASAPSAILDRFKEPGEGWYFYKDPKPPKPHPPPPPPPPPPAPPPQSTPKAVAPKALSVAWIRKHLPVVTDAAIDDPTPENIRTFLYMQRIMLDKSDVFASMAARVGTSDPTLNEDTRSPSMTAQRFGQAVQRLTVKRSALKSVSGEVGLWIFVDGKCGFCKLGLDLARKLARDSNIPLRIISVDGTVPESVQPGEYVVDINRAAARRFGVRLIPATLLVAPPDKVAIVAHGAVNSIDELEEKILTAANEFGLLKADAVLALNARERGIIRPDDMRSLLELSRTNKPTTDRSSEGNDDDPTPQQVMAHVQKLLSSRLDIEESSKETKSK